MIQHDYKIFFMYVGKEIKMIRKNLKMTRKELSEKTGIREEYIKKIESGKAYGLSTTKFFKIAYALKTAPHKILKDFKY